MLICYTEQATVTLVPQPCLGNRTDLYTSTVSDPTGYFEIGRITPGIYTLFAWEEVENGAWMDPSFAQEFETAGTVVSIEAGALVRIDLIAIPPVSLSEMPLRDRRASRGAAARPRPETRY